MLSVIKDSMMGDIPNWIIAVVTLVSGVGGVLVCLIQGGRWFQRIGDKIDRICERQDQAEETIEKISAKLESNTERIIRIEAATQKQGSA